MKPFKIRDIEINPPLILSPMAGVTDYTFRRLIKRRSGVGLVVSEFISVEGLTRHNPKSKRQMRFDEEERPFAVQIFGGQPERMALGAEMAQEVGADILDVNCGCPAPKVVKHGGGFGAFEGFAEIGNYPQSDKKSDYDSAHNENARRFFRFDDQLHGSRANGGSGRRRTYSSSRSHTRTGLQRLGKLGFDSLGQRIRFDSGIRQRRHHDDRIRLKKWSDSGCDGILIGRGAMQNPWIFRQFADALADAKFISRICRRKKPFCSNL
jgi:tRNA-dihydrouridine synthase B